MTSSKNTVASVRSELNDYMEANSSDMAEIRASLREMSEALASLTSGKGNGKKSTDKKQERDWLTPFPADYGTAAQRVEYDKLAERARNQYKDVCKALGTDSVTAFIPVPKEQGRMPHTIKWSAKYSK